MQWEAEGEGARLALSLAEVQNQRDFPQIPEETTTADAARWALAVWSVARGAAPVQGKAQGLDWVVDPNREGPRQVVEMQQAKGPSKAARFQTGTQVQHPTRIRRKMALRFLSGRTRRREQKR